MTEPQRHDWQNIIAEIKAGYIDRHGRSLTNGKLGASVGLDHSSIRHLEQHADAQPKHHEGERLLEMHREYANGITSGSGSSPIVQQHESD